MQTPLQTPIQTPLPGSVDNSLYNIPTGPSDYPSVHDSGNVTEMKAGRPSPYMVNFMLFLSWKLMMPLLFARRVALL